MGSLIALFRGYPHVARDCQSRGLHRRDYGKSHGVGLAAAIVAANAEVEKADLKTLNTKHYPMFKSLRPAYTKA